MNISIYFNLMPFVASRKQEMLWQVGTHLTKKIAWQLLKHPLKFLSTYRECNGESVIEKYID